MGETNSQKIDILIDNNFPKINDSILLLGAKFWGCKSPFQMSFALFCNFFFLATLIFRHCQTV